MIRWTLLAMFVSSMALAMTGCTNTVRGLGQDLNSNTVQNYNSRTASDYAY